MAEVEQKKTRRAAGNRLLRRGENGTARSTAPGVADMFWKRLPKDCLRLDLRIVLGKTGMRVGESGADDQGIPSASAVRDREQPDRRGIGPQDVGFGGPASLDRMPPRRILCRTRHD